MFRLPGVLASLLVLGLCGASTAQPMPGQPDPNQPPPSEDEKATSDVRIVKDLDQRPCANVASDEECLAFAQANECEGNAKWMNKNCEKTCRRCLDHVTFWHGGNVTQVAGKKQLTALRKRDEKMIVMFHHQFACPECNFARPFYAEVASDIVGKSRGIEDIDVVAAVDCQKTEKTCMAMIKTWNVGGSFPFFRFFGDAADWSKGGTGIGPADFVGLGGIVNASDAFDEALFAFDGDDDDDDDEAGGGAGGGGDKEL